MVLAGGAVYIYSFSNVGYTVSFGPVLIGYYLLRQDKPHLRRPFKLPEFMKYVALAVAAIYFVFWLFGGLWYSESETSRLTTGPAGRRCSPTSRSIGIASRLRTSASLLGVLRRASLCEQPGWAPPGAPNFPSPTSDNRHGAEIAAALAVEPSAR